MSEEITQKVDIEDIFAPKFHTAEMVFAATMVALTAFLLTQYDAQTRIIEGQSLTRQPGFWSWVSVGGMAVFGLPYLVAVVAKLRRETGSEPALQEVRIWLRSIEFAAWFLAYVLLVPQIGYLLATVVFSTALTARVGYRQSRFYLWAVVFSFVTVTVFKGFLKVSVPGGAIYELFPPGIRYFLISNF